MSAPRRDVSGYSGDGKERWLVQERWCVVTSPEPVRRCLRLVEGERCQQAPVAYLPGELTGQGDMAYCVGHLNERGLHVRKGKVVR